MLLPLADFEAALQTEALLDDLLDEEALVARIARGPGNVVPFEDFVRELGFEKELELE